jgi:branched-chain amino acid aminotransferase
LVIEWSNDSGFEVVERDVNPNELWDADEVFITSSTRDVHPVSELAKLDSTGKVVEQRTLVPGLVTEKLGNIFATLRTEKINP